MYSTNHERSEAKGAAKQKSETQRTCMHARTHAAATWFLVFDYFFFPAFCLHMQRNMKE